MAAAQAALAAANRDRAQAQSALETAERAIRRAQDDLDDADREHRRIGERCADDVLDARDLPFHTHAWDFVSSSIPGHGRPGLDRLPERRRDDAGGRGQGDAGQG
jgi:hypothetical protein